MRTEEYNGWSNYETWCVNMWMSNDKNSYDFWMYTANKCIQDAKDGFVVLRLADKIQEHHETLVESLLHSPASFLNDLVNAALAEVNWREIAESWVAKTHEY